MQGEPTLSWNPAHDLGELFEFHFMVNALLAGTVVAMMAGALGWFVVLRREVFAGHTLAMMAFPGAAGATLIGAPAVWGYFAFCGAGALAIGAATGGRGRSWSEQSASVGAVQALALALGFLFVSLYGGVLNNLESLLFGTFLGVSDAEVLTLAAIAAATLVVLLAFGRRLLLASVDPELAQARGVGPRGVSLAFLGLLALVVAATSQITGVLLVFALLVAPAASAQAISSRPAPSLALTLALSLAIVWGGLGLAYFSEYPAGFFIATIAFALYALARACAWARERAGRGAGRAPEEPAPPGGDRASAQPQARGVIA